MLYGYGKSIEDVSGPLAQCVMDMPQVRLALVEVAGSLGLHMPDRYAYWPRILPLLLFGCVLCLFVYFLPWISFSVSLATHVLSGKIYY